MSRGYEGHPARGPGSPEEQLFTALAMEAYGGSFVHCLGRAYRHADAFNRVKIELAFPDYMSEYGPDSQSYRLIALREKGPK